MTEGLVLCFIPVAERIPVLLIDENNHLVVTRDQDHTGLLLWTSRDAEEVDVCIYKRDRAEVPVGHLFLERQTQNLLNYLWSNIRFLENMI